MASDVCKKPFLGIMFQCCHAYRRIYRNREGTAYEGRCPRCGMRARVPIRSNGTSRRFFVGYPRRAA